MDSYATLYLGATPVYVDINPDTWNIDAEQIEKSITDKTKAIIVVSLYGLPVDIDPIMELARKHNKIAATPGGPNIASEYIDMGYNLLNIGSDVIGPVSYTHLTLPTSDLV
mgnify:CR=1 FL=1